MKLAAFALLCTSVAHALNCSAPWEFAGPTGWVAGFDDLQTFHEDEGFEDQDSDFETPYVTASTSTHRIVAGKDGSWLAATCNAGIWRTANISVSEPHWEPVTDGQPVTCTAMAALEVASFNSDLVAAGCGGSTSGEMGATWNELITGEWRGVMLSQDGGDTWGMTTFPENYNIGSVRFIKPSTLLVAARGHFFDSKKGGIWKSTDLGQTWTQTFAQPTVDLVVLPSEGLVIAALGETAQISYKSADNGATWTVFSEGIDFGGYIPFYAHMAVSAVSPPTVFLAVYAVNSTNPSITHSTIWHRTLNSSSQWTPVKNTPNSLDADKMPKDKIAVLPDPTDPTILYVAANVGNMFRVQWQTGAWVRMDNSDTYDGSNFHADCRHVAWDDATGDLLLSNDGGVHRRTQPQKHKGGQWFGSAGDIRTMEFSYASWDARNQRFVAGAQDNSVQITLPLEAQSKLETPFKLRATGVVGGDGNRVFIDNVHCPARMFGSAQNFDGLSYTSGGADGTLTSVRVDVTETFSSPWNFPYFVAAAALNSQDPSQLFFYANGTSVGRPKGVYKVTVPDQSQVVIPELVAEVEHVYDIVVGGFSQGKSDPSITLMLTPEKLYTLRDGELSSMALPMKFFTQVTFKSLNEEGDNWVLGPLSHGNAVWLTVSPKDSEVLAVTGYPADINTGDEGIFFSNNGGQEFQNVIGNLAKAAGVSSKTRPQGLLLVDLDEIQALLVGTVNGVYVTFSDNFGDWSRVSSLASTEFPLVMVIGLSYEPYTDTLVAATYGRGVFTAGNALQMLLHVHDQQEAGSCIVPVPPAPSSLAPFFPPMQSC